MLHAELLPLAAELRRRGMHITVETAGTLYLPVACDLMSISPKLANSAPPQEQHPRWHRRHERTRNVPEVIRRLVAEYPYQLKFVIDSRSDCVEVERYLADLPHVERSRVMLMPQGTDSEAARPSGRVAQALLPNGRSTVLPAPTDRMVRPGARNVRKWGIRNGECGMWNERCSAFHSPFPIPHSTFVMSCTAVRNERSAILKFVCAETSG